MKKKKTKIAVAVSGGVDSAVSAFLLKEQGYEVFGLFMKLTDKQSVSEFDARQVCDFLDIKFYPINLNVQFEKTIISYFLDSYQNGQTPNPCIRCNQKIKFGQLLRVSQEIGADFLATGHYLRNEFNQKNKRFELFQGKDKRKDQSYFLYTLTPKQLKSIRFPLGNFYKEDVKKIAKKIKLPCLSKESQDICFLSGDHNDFLKEKLNLKPGKIKNKEGKTLGGHNGLPLYTLGQRKGIELGGNGPFYVFKLDYENNILWVSPDFNDKEFYSEKILIKKINWLGEKSKEAINCLAVSRYRQTPVEVDFYLDKGEVFFKEKQRALTSGQSLVFYQGEQVLGGGIII